MQQSPSWRDLLREVTENNVERQQIARALGVNTITLTRWAESRARPRLHYRQKLIDAMPTQMRQEFATSLSKEFPEDAQPSSGNEEELITEIPSAFYARIFSAYTSTPGSLRSSSIFTIILQQMLVHLDPDQEGLYISIIRCTRPTAGILVRSLQEIFGRGTPPFKMYQEMQPMLLGIESLAGVAVMQFSKQINQNLSEESYRPALQTEFEESAMACPLTFEGRIAGCSLVASTQVNFFTPRRQQLVQDYTNLLVARSHVPAGWAAPRAGVRRWPCGRVRATHPSRADRSR
jgi:transcriptional regulator with XRE-family HTH domain